MSSNLKMPLPALLLAISVAWSCTNVRADSIGSLDEAIAKVDQYQQSQQLWAQRQQMSDLSIRQSGLWQNPTFSLTNEGFQSGKNRDTSFSISQPLDVFGNRKVNQEIAKLAGEQNQLQEKLWLAQSQLVVKYAWSQFVIAQFEASIQKNQLAISRETLESARKRYQAGSLALVDYERAQIEAAENERIYQQMILNKEIAKRFLSNLWGETEADIQVNQQQVYWPDQAERIVQSYIAQGYLEKLFALNLQQSQHKIRQLKVKAKPNPNVSFGMTQSKAPGEQNNTALLLGMDIPLNIFNRQQYQIPLVEQQRQLMKQQQQRELKQQILDIASAFHQVKGLQRQMQSIMTQHKLAEQVQIRTQQGFQAGKLSIAEVQQAANLLQTIRLNQIQLLRQAWQTALSAEALSIGTSYEEISRSDAYTQLMKQAIDQSQNFIDLGAE